jgi:hypothetical protein
VVLIWDFDHGYFDPQEKKHFVRKDVKADIVGQMDILRLELKALKQQESGEFICSRKPV